MSEDDDEPLVVEAPAPRAVKRGRAAPKVTNPAAPVPQAPAAVATGSIDAPAPAIFTTSQSPEYHAARLHAERVACGWWIPFDAAQCLDSRGERLKETPDGLAPEADVAAWINNPTTQFGQPDLFLGSDTVVLAHRLPMPEDCFDEQHAWLDPACPVIAEVTAHREAIFRLERGHYEGNNPNREVEPRAVECVNYRAVVNPERYDPSRKYSLNDFMSNIEEDPFFTHRHRQKWSILKNSGRIVAMNVFTLAGTPSFSRYPNSGSQFKYQLGVYLRADKANRDLCDPARRSATRAVLRKLFRIYHPTMTRDKDAELLPVPLVGDGTPSSPELLDWLAELETSKAARTLSFASSRARSEPYFRLGPGGMVFNYLTGEFASTCPPSWLLPLPELEHLEKMRLGLHIVEDGLLAGAKHESIDHKGNVGRPILEGFVYRRIVVAMRQYDYNSSFLAEYCQGLRAGLMIGFYDESQPISTDVLHKRLRPVINCHLPRDVHVAKLFVDHVPFFALVQLLVEARAALAAGVTSVQVPGPASEELADYGVKIEAIAKLLQTDRGARRPAVIWCQSPTLAALIARAIAKTTDLNVIDAASPNMALANRAFTEFDQASQQALLQADAIVLSLNSQDGSVLKAPIFPARLKEIEQMIFVHPIVGEDEAETLKLVDRAVRISNLSDLKYRWLVAKDTVEAQLMQPIMANQLITAKYGFAQVESPIVVKSGFARTE
ncbi:hypothetical protein H9P43_008302 [Blastocladiella emersonii ATCC 22665]|nr:hypothetical protein H9P43_008302 [Blastocladiella emersonii ATCC 22665]